MDFARAKPSSRKGESDRSRRKDKNTIIMSARCIIVAPSFICNIPKVTVIVILFCNVDFSSCDNETKPKKGPGPQRARVPPPDINILCLYR